MPPRSLVPLTVFTILINDHNQVLLTRRANTGFGDGCYGLPGGHVEKDELIPDAAIRETKEEVGIDILNCQVKGVIHSEADREYLHFIVVAHPDDWQGHARNLEPDQCDDILWCPLGQLPDNTLPCVLIALQNIDNGLFFNQYFPHRS